MSFRLTFEATGARSDRFGSDRYATAEWRHGARFAARVFEDFETTLDKATQSWGSFDGIEAALTLVVEPQHGERVLPQVFVYPDAEGSKPARIEAFVHVPKSFADTLGTRRPTARLAFRQEPRALFALDGGDRLGERCTILDASNVVIDLAEAGA